MTVRSSTFHADVSEAVDLAAKYKGPAAAKIVRDELIVAGQRSGRHARDRANARIKSKSRALVSSAKVDTRLTGKSITTTVEWGAKHAQWVNNGRGPVVAIRARALRFEISGQILFRKRVGPAPAQHFAERGLQVAEPQIIAEHARARDRIVTRLEAL